MKPTRPRTDPLTMTRKQVLTLFGVPGSTLDSWSKDSGFRPARAARDSYDVAFIRRWLDNRLGSPSVRQQHLDALFRYWQARRRREELKVRDLLATVIPTAQVVADLEAVASGIERHLRKWADALPARLAGLEEPKIETILRREVYDTLSFLSSGVKSVLCEKRPKKT